jgi:lipoprotein-releasing system ATP-binding protein
MTRKKNAETLIIVQGVTKSFQLVSGVGKRLDVLRGVDLQIRKGEIVAIVGASGAGKSTLLHIMGALDRPTGGKVSYDGENIFALNDEKLARFRNRSIGFVFQFHHLLPEFSALENVIMPALIRGDRLVEAIDKGRQMLATVGLSNRLQHKPTELSGGEQQRVAVARAMINAPLVILADEPTGNLDSANAEAVHEMIFELNEANGQTFVLVTHNEKLARRADCVLRMADGEIQKH